MAQFILYTYQFAPFCNIKHSQIDLFGNITLPAVDLAMQNKLETFSKKIVDIKFTHGSNMLNKQILYNEDNIIIFRLANKKKITTEKNFVKSEDLNEPSIIVFINNNEKVQRIAIEEQKSIFSDTSVVVGIIKKSLTPILEKENLVLSIKKEFQETEFWETINSYNDALTMLRFTFEYPNLPRARTDMSDLLKSISKDIGGASSTTQFNASSEGVLGIDQTNEQIRTLAKEASETGNQIKFKIKGDNKIRNIGKSNKSLNIEVEGISNDANDFQEVLKALKDFTDNV